MNRIFFIPLVLAAAVACSSNELPNSDGGLDAASDGGVDSSARDSSTFDSSADSSASDSSSRDSSSSDSSIRDSSFDAQDANRSDADAAFDSNTPNDGGDGAVTASLVVINEVQTNVHDWVELIATGPTNLSRWAITDSDNGVPHLGHRTALPAFSLLAGDRFVVAEWTGETAMPEGLQTDCLVGGQIIPRCTWVSYGLSGSAGDAVYIFEENQERDSVLIAGGTLPTDGSRTWCRLPERTGAFGLCSPTPHTANLPPPL